MRYKDRGLPLSASWLTFLPTRCSTMWIRPPNRNLIFLLVICASVTHIETCNEVVCASVVTKCMLMESCACSVSSCSCCPSCLRCLGDFFTECCECVNMCEGDTDFDVTPRIFHEERLNGSPALFEALIADPDPEDNWLVETFPVKISSILGDEAALDESFLQWYSKDEDRLSKDILNCSVIFLNDCTSQMKCQMICESMGAENSVWFQDGCCECAGCPKHLIYESKCLSCPASDRRITLDDYDDYGQVGQNPMYDEYDGNVDYGEDDK